MEIFKQAIDCKYSVDRDLLILNTGHGLYKFKIENNELRENVHEVASLLTKELQSIEEEQSSGSNEGLNHYAMLLLATLNICEKYTKLEKKYEQVKTTLNSVQKSGAAPKRLESFHKNKSFPARETPMQQDRGWGGHTGDTTTQAKESNPQTAPARTASTPEQAAAVKKDVPVPATTAPAPTGAKSAEATVTTSPGKSSEPVETNQPHKIKEQSVITTVSSGVSSPSPAATKGTEARGDVLMSSPVASSQRVSEDTKWQQARPNPTHNDIFKAVNKTVEEVSEPEGAIAEVEEFQIVSDPLPQEPAADAATRVIPEAVPDPSSLKPQADVARMEETLEEDSTPAKSEEPEEPALLEEFSVDGAPQLPEEDSPVEAEVMADESAAQSPDTLPQSASECVTDAVNQKDSTEQEPDNKRDHHNTRQEEIPEDDSDDQDETYHVYEVETGGPVPSLSTSPAVSTPSPDEENGQIPVEDTENGAACFYEQPQNPGPSQPGDTDSASEEASDETVFAAEDESAPDDTETEQNFRDFEISPPTKSSNTAPIYEQNIRRVSGLAENAPKSDPGNYQLPLLSFLRNTSSENQVDHNRIRSDAELLEKKLGYFGIKGEVMGIHPGPVITTYEYRPDPGIKISKIVNLADDLALALSAFSIRIVAPIPGKDVMGIEIPNIKKSLVPFIDIVTSDTFRLSQSKVPICLGKDIVGNPVVVELESMPHLLIAGATGTGKSVGLNAMITSILFKATPDEVRFLMIDPKRIELSFYNDIPHLLTPVITDMNKANTALQWMVREMDRRYNLLAEYQVRHIEQFNQKLRDAGEDQYDTHGEQLEPMPYIVVIIDELADLMMTASRDIEFSLTRLAQMARAAGIHLILATQRPSVDVLTGIIKANFPTRISFQVSSKTDSRTIIDSNGAETLLGNGDMLFVPPGTARLTRVHGTYVSEDELVEITSFIKEQRKPEYVFDVLAEQDPGEFETGGSQDEYDEKYNEALDYVMTTRQASISGVQRALRVGYNRAARIIDLMEKNGVVGPSDGVKPRKVLTNSMMM